MTKRKVSFFTRVIHVSGNMYIERGECEKGATALKYNSHFHPLFCYIENIRSVFVHLGILGERYCLPLEDEPNILKCTKTRT